MLVYAEVGDYLAILQQLIGFPTISENSNLECIEYIESYLSERHFRTRRIYNREQTKANLIASIGPQLGGGVMLAGHTDVVPVEGQEWFTDPFQLVQRDDRLYGRGCSDMKGFLALAMALAGAIDPGRLSRPIYLLFSYDEEVGCLGAKRLVDVLKNMQAPPQFVLIGEPTDMDLVTAHKGICLSTTQVRGRAAHSSCPDLGANAILAALKLIQQIDSLLPTEQDERFDPPVATFNIGTIKGGNACNIIPQDCGFSWEFRCLPDQDATVVQDRFSETILQLQGEMPGITIDHKTVSFVPGLSAGKNQEFAMQLQRYLKHSKLTTVPFVTEAGLYQEAGIPALVCGPGHVNQAHQPNECVPLARMEQYRTFLNELLATLSTA